ncbi:MAG: cell division protein ZapA [Nitrospinota bacterium]
MAEQVVKVDIFGQSLVLRTEADEPFARELARFVDERVRRAAHQSPEPLKVALLAALNITGELFEVRQQMEVERREISRRAERILQMVERAL